MRKTDCLPLSIKSLSSLSVSVIEEGRQLLRTGHALAVCASVDEMSRCSEACLDAAEQRRSMAYACEADRRRHDAAHALKRWLIGGLLGCPPLSLEFAAEDGGKPRIEDRALHFNLAHSGGWVGVAIHLDTEVGIDVECGGRCLADLLALPIHHPEDALPVDRSTFLQAWVLKEAVAKCCGEGLRMNFAGLRLKHLAPSAYRCDGGCDRAVDSGWSAWHARIDAQADVAVAAAVDVAGCSLYVLKPLQ